MKYSVIIPVLNEAATIADCIESVRELNPEAEIIVADGRSTDGTVGIATENRARTCLSPPGRGTQCNAGAAIAQGDVLLFLHVDTRLPGNAFPLLEAAFNDPKTKFGVFKLSFDVRHWFLNILPHLIRLPLPFLRFGDQCFVVRRGFFQSLGGFPERALYEDTGFATKAARHSRIRVFPAPVTTSARRFVGNGAVRQFLHDGVSLFRYLTGADPEKLAQSYRNVPEKPATALMAMARRPEPGRVKTRLARTLGPEPAARVYQVCADTAFRQMKRVPGTVNRYLFVAGDNGRSPNWSRGPWRPPFYHASQRGNDLGERLSDAFRTVFRHGAARAVALATDVPDLTSGIIARAADVLANHDIVLGPCPDGGYYLIGMNRLHEELFAGIDWSTERVMEQTLAAAARLGLSGGLLPELADIDTLDDLSRWAASADTRHPLSRFLRHKLPEAASGDGQTAVDETTTDFEQRFTDLMAANGLAARPHTIDTLWVNITRKCNQSCSHCHVGASPRRSEEMDPATMDACLAFLERNDTCTCLDITGGAPELHPRFELLVIRARELGKRVVVRTNLTVLLDGAGRSGNSRLADFYAANEVELIASLPHYRADITDSVRGEGVHRASLKALEALNQRGYGRGALVLNLMHNAEGPLCPADREDLEAAYRAELSRLGLHFTSLYTVTNVPIARYRRRLEERQEYGPYLERLAADFNPDSVETLACRLLVSVGPDGTVYDCDFNQALGRPVLSGGAPLSIFTAELEGLLNRKIRFGGHCLGCTAGGGSS